MAEILPFVKPERVGCTFTTKAQDDMDKKLTNIWSQTTIPVLKRQQGGSLTMRLPYAKGNRNWLQNGRRINPVWNAAEKVWELPKSWFNDLVDRCLLTFGAVYIIQPYREQEKCAPACWNAAGHICECSCMGERHGMGESQGNWKIVSDVFATKWGDEEIAIRLLTRANILP